MISSNGGIAKADQTAAEAGTSDSVWMSPLQTLNSVTANAPDSAVTGDISYSFASTKTGWLKVNGQTIGDVGSGATDASADYEALYTVFYDNCTDTECPVSTGRGASAAADFAAGKTLTIPDGRGRSPLAADNLGGSSANVNTNAYADALGATGGEQTHTQTEAELENHNHTYGNTADDVASGAGTAVNDAQNSGSFSTNATGSSTAFNVVQPVLTMNMFVKT